MQVLYMGKGWWVRSGFSRDECGGGLWTRSKGMINYMLWWARSGVRVNR